MKSILYNSLYLVKISVLGQLELPELFLFVECQNNEFFSFFLQIKNQNAFLDVEEPFVCSEVASIMST